MSRDSGRTSGNWDLQVIRLGKELVHRFFILSKTAGNYALGHPAMEPPLRDLMAVIRDIHRRREEASFSMRDEHLFCGENRLKPDAGGFDAYLYIVRLMRDLSIGSIVFADGVTPQELDGMVHLLGMVEQKDLQDPFTSLLGLMERWGVERVEVERLPEVRVIDEEAERDLKERAKVTYSQTINVISEVMEDVKLGKTLKMKKSKRVVQRLIDSLLTAETNLLGLTSIRSHDEYTYNHSVNVGILSLAIGQRLRLHKRNLVELGMAAMFHDIGKSCIPIQILNKPTSFNPEEWEVMKRHPVMGVKELLRLKGVDALTARIMTGAFEHHLNFDLSGYPRVPYSRRPSLFGSIISIADCYDAFSSSRVYSRKAESPDRTLQFMLSRSATYYDPILMKLFVNCVGVYPLGTLCYLDTGELAVVMESNPDPVKWNLPKVKIVGDARGQEIDGVTVDLSHRSAGRKILRTVDGMKYGIDVAHYFM